MNAVILIILSLFATIGVAFLIDAIMKLLLYDKSSIQDMELKLFLKGDNTYLCHMVRILADDSFAYKTQNSICKITVIDKGLSKYNQENMDYIAKIYNNIQYIKDYKE